MHKKSAQSASAGAELKALLLPKILGMYGTQERFAAELGVTKGAVTAWWRTGQMSAARVAEVSRLLHIPVADVHSAMGIQGPSTAEVGSDPVMDRFLAALAAVTVDRDHVLQLLTAIVENMESMYSTRSPRATVIDDWGEGWDEPVHVIHKQEKRRRA